jgi:hypothetical protein
MTAATPAIDRREKAALLDLISRRIEQRERLEIELGVDLRTLLGLPDLADLRRGLEILRREVALHASQEART